jgi:serine/threonine protein kinase
LGVDIWSCGCIFAEFFTLRPVFAAKSESEALDKAFRILGYPTKEHSPHLLELEKIQTFKLKHYPITSLDASFPMINNPLALDLLSKLLALDPRDRITAKEALRHDFFKPLTRKQEVEYSTKCKGLANYGK